MESTPIKIAKKTANSEIATSVKSQALLNNQTSLNIVHEGQVYILRVTKQGKLILTK
jgi:hemin uptake protein HemP